MNPQNPKPVQLCVWFRIPFWDISGDQTGDTPIKVRLPSPAPLSAQRGESPGLRSERWPEPPWSARWRTPGRTSNRRAPVAACRRLGLCRLRSTGFDQGSEIGGRLVSKLSKDHLGWLEEFWRLKNVSTFQFIPFNKFMFLCWWGVMDLTLSTKNAKHDPTWVTLPIAELHTYMHPSVSPNVKKIFIYSHQKNTFEVYTSLGRIGLYPSCTCYKALHFFGAWHVQKEPRSLGPGAELLLVSLGHRHCQCIWATWGGWSQGIRRVARIFDKGGYMFYTGFKNSYNGVMVVLCCFMEVAWGFIGFCGCFQLNWPPTAQRRQLKANCFHSILSQTSRKVPKWSSGHNMT